MPSEEEKKRAAEAKAAEEKRSLEVAYIRSSMPINAPIAQEEPTKDKKKVSVRSDDIDMICQMYKEKYSKNPDGTSNPNYTSPRKNSKGEMELAFSSVSELTSFCQEAAGNNLKFIVLDEQNKVLAYSNGDGKLRKGDHSEYAQGEELKASDVPFDKFQMVEPETSSPRPF